MPLLTKGSSSAWAALTYVTVGSLTIVWTLVYFTYLWNRQGAEAGSHYYWCAGFLATGVTLVVIGFSLGWIGRAARHAELPPPEVMPIMANVEQNAAARAPMVAPNPAAPVGNPGVPAGMAPAQGAGMVPPVAAVPGQPVVQR